MERESEGERETEREVGWVNEKGGEIYDGKCLLNSWDSESDPFLVLLLKPWVLQLDKALTMYDKPWYCAVVRAL